MPTNETIYDPYIHVLQNGFEMPGNHLKRAIIHKGIPEIIFLFDSLTADISRQFMEKALSCWDTLCDGIMPIMGLDTDFSRETIDPGTIVIQVS